MHVSHNIVLTLLLVATSIAVPLKTSNQCGYEVCIEGMHYSSLHVDDILDMQSG